MNLKRCYIQGDNHSTSIYLKPWHFIYDSESEKIVRHDFPENAKAFVRDQK